MMKVVMRVVMMVVVNAVVACENIGLYGGKVRMIDFERLVGFDDGQTDRQTN